MPTTIALFVYGSLKRGCRHHGLLRRGVRLGAASVPGCRLALLDEYPALVEAPDSWVKGELYSVDRVLLADLDAFEDCPRLYRRRWVMLTNGSWAFAYFVGDRSDIAHQSLPGSEWIE